MRITQPLRHSLQRLYHPTRFMELNRLLQSQQCTPKALQRQQQQQLTTLIQHAVSHTPFYANHLHDTDRPLQQLPILHKHDLIRHGHSMVDRTADPTTLLEGFTGGSTGTPLKYFYDHKKIELLRAGQYRSFMQCGWRPGDRVIQLWGATQDLSKPTTIKQHWHNWVSAEQTIPAFKLDEEKLQQWYQQISSYRPVVIRGYPSILAALARYLMDEHLTLPNSIKGCFSTAEVLYPQQREQITVAFRCKVYNQYGSREIPNISCECSHGRQHVFTDLVALESVEREGVNQLLVTSLTNTLMPLIRYQIGDQGRLLEESCSCGSPFPLMEMEVCRSNDLLQTPTGRRIYPSQFIHLLDGIEGIAQYQFRQTTTEQIILSIVSDEPFAPPLASTLQTTLQTKVAQEVDPTLQLQLELVGEIPRGASGKHRFVCCDLD